ncbi:MAG: hypothetical protein LQ340_004152 [Diploschistes diacapsis]|nr:MAG: hypothetical protein LQ340_004152 [Diploschistes diacapsis]
MENSCPKWSSKKAPDANLKLWKERFDEMKGEATQQFPSSLASKRKRKSHRTVDPETTAREMSMGNSKGTRLERTEALPIGSSSEGGENRPSENGNGANRTTAVTTEYRSLNHGHGHEVFENTKAPTAYQSFPNGENVAALEALGQAEGS